MNNSSISKQTTTVKELKEKLHKSFLDLSNLQQLYKEEIQSLKGQYEKRILELQNQNTLLKSKLVQLEPSIYDKTFTSIFNEIDQSVIMPGIRKKASLFLQDELKKVSSDLQGMKIKILSLQKDVKKQLGTKIPNKLSQYFQTVKNMFQSYCNIQQQLHKTRDIVQNYEKVKQTQKKRLKDQINELKRQNALLSNQYGKVSSMWKNQLLALENMKKQKQKQINSSASVKSVKMGDDLWGSKRTSDSQRFVAKSKGMGLVNPKSRIFNQSSNENYQ